MASSTLFRGRRIVDPVPVQRGPLPRDEKYQTSFSGSAFEEMVKYRSKVKVLAVTVALWFRLLSFQD